MTKLDLTPDAEGPMIDPEALETRLERLERLCRLQQYLLMWLHHDVADILPKNVLVALLQANEYTSDMSSAATMIEPDCERLLREHNERNQGEL